MNTKEPRYAVICNPERILFKYEVWYAGTTEVELGMDPGKRVEISVCKPVKVCMTSNLANEYVRYQKEVRAFKEEVNE